MQLITFQRQNNGSRNKKHSWIWASPLDLVTYIQKTFWFHIIGSYCHSCLYGSIYLTSISTLVGIRFNKLQYSNWIISNSIQISIIQISNDWNNNNICWKIFPDWSIYYFIEIFYYNIFDIGCLRNWDLMTKLIRMMVLRNTLYLWHLCHH